MTRGLRDAFPARRIDPMQRAASYVDRQLGLAPDPVRDHRWQRAQERAARVTGSAAVQTLETMPSDPTLLEPGRIYRVGTTPAQFVVQGTNADGDAVIQTLTVT